MRKIWKYSSIILAVVILFVVSLVLLVQTSFFREKVKERLVVLIENQLTLKVQIEELEGNFYNCIAAKNVMFTENDTLVASLAGLKINYQLFPLFRKNICIDSLIFTRPEINLHQKEDSLWNFSTFLKANSDKNETTTTSFPFEINANYIAIRGGNVAVYSLSQFIPHHTSGIHLEVSASYGKNETYINLRKFQFKTENPAIVLNNLSGICTMNSEGIKIDSLLLHAGNSNLDFEGEYVSLKKLNGRINSGFIDRNDLALYIPTFQLLCSPSINVNFATVNNSATVNVELKHENQSLTAGISVEAVEELLNKEGLIPYAAKIAFSNFQVGDWIESEEHQGLVNGNFMVQGKNLLNTNAQANATGHFQNIQYNTIAIDALDLSGTYENQQLSARMDVTTGFGNVKMSGSLNNTETPSYKALLKCDNFAIDKFIPELMGTKVNGVIATSGTGFSLDKLKADAKIKLYNSSIYKVPFDTLIANLKVSNTALNIGLLQAFAPGAFVAGSGRVDLNTLALDSRLYANIRSLEAFNSFVDLPLKLDSVTTEATFSGALNRLAIDGELNAYNVEGYSSNMEHLQSTYSVLLNEDWLPVGKAQIKLHNSSVYRLPFDSLYTNLNFQKTDLKIDSLQVYAPGASLAGGGHLNFDSLFIDAKVYGDIHSVEVIDSFVLLPITFDSARSVATIKGFFNDFDIDGELDISHLLGYGSDIQTANTQYQVSVRDDSLDVQLNTTAFALKTGPIEFDTAFVDFSYNSQYMNVATDFRRNDHLNTQIDCRLSLGDTTSVEISKFEVQTAFANFYMPDSMKAHMYNYQNLEVDNFRILDRNNKDFIVDVNGNFSNSEFNNFQILVKYFNLSQLSWLIGDPDLLDGYFNTNIMLKGSASNPVINGNVQVKNPEFEQYAFTSVESNFGYADGKGFAELTVPEMGNSFTAKINAPFNAYFDSLNFVFDLPKEFEGSLVFNSLNVAKTVKTFMPNDSIRGVLNGKIQASGSLFTPLFYGNLSLADGKYINKNLGVEYNNIETSLSFDGNKMNFDTLLVRQKNGFISVGGEIEFDSTIIKGNVTNTSLQIDAKQFFLVKHRNYEVLIDANTFIKSINQQPEFGGKIKVLHSDFYLPALMSDTKTDIENDIPLLVEAMQSSVDSTAKKTIISATPGKNKKQKKGFSDQLKGKLNLEIPRNTWIRSNDIRIELSGELEIVKTDSYFEFFGNIDVLRGYYILYGKKLNVTESQIIFQGGEKLDPSLQIQAEYIYRGTDNQKRYLNLTISGTMSEPEIAFTLDGTEITETDGVSVLIFGATSDEIGYSGQNGLIGSISSKAVANMVSSQLSKTLGSQFKLDMIEITSTENWQSAALVVGKYLTNNIFVIYERGFGETDGDEITPETVTVEYEINDKLFLRLQSGSSENSGVDIILKFEKEMEKKGRSLKKKKN